MRPSIFKTIMMGAFFGAALFFAPMFLAGIFICFGLFGMMMRRRMHHIGFGHHQFAFADKIRGMNEEEYETFRTKMSEARNTNCCHRNNCKKEEASNTNV